MPADISLPDAAATVGVGEALSRGVAAGARPAPAVGSLARARRRWSGGWLRGLGFTGRVKSPSYTLVEPYSISRLNLYHFWFLSIKDRTEC